MFFRLKETWSCRQESLEMQKVNKIICMCLNFSEIKVFCVFFLNKWDNRCFKKRWDSEQRWDCLDKKTKHHLFPWNRRDPWEDGCEQSEILRWRETELRWYMPEDFTSRENEKDILRWKWKTWDETDWWGLENSLEGLGVKQQEANSRWIAQMWLGSGDT